jgi:hypothetical protein
VTTESLLSQALGAITTGATRTPSAADAATHQIFDAVADPGGTAPPPIPDADAAELERAALADLPPQPGGAAVPPAAPKPSSPVYHQAAYQSHPALAARARRA